MKWKISQIHFVEKIRIEPQELLKIKLNNINHCITKLKSKILPQKIKLSRMKNLKN